MSKIISPAVIDGKGSSATAADKQSSKHAHALHCIQQCINTGDCFHYDEDEDEGKPIEDSLRAMQVSL
jgi:hypothetical protein